MNIRTFVFLDLETTGLPREERNHTKITELCLIAISRYDILVSKNGRIPACHKLSLLFNPERNINPVAARITGLTNEYLKNCPTFVERVDTITFFLEELEEPVCLVAHNGSAFDFKVLLAEFVKIERILPKRLLCLDSLLVFRKILKDNPVNYKTLNSSADDSILTDDEDDDFPALSLSNEDWTEIDRLDTPQPNMSFRGVSSNTTRIISNSQRSNYTLTSLYKRLLNKDATNAHRAEGDCVMLLECVMALKEDFLFWADASCKRMDTVKPFVPY